MSIQTVLIKLGCVGLVALGLTACSSMPSMDGVFVDQKESYKKAHVLPSLEMPPELSAGSVKDEYDGGTSTAAVTPTTSTPVGKVKAVTTPLNDELQTTAEIIHVGTVSYLLIHDSFRNAWRKTLGALDALDYDIEDKNREDNLIYLNIAEANAKSGMLSSLSFWKDNSTSVYLISFDQYSDGIALEVQDSDGQLINNDISKKIYADLLTKLAP
jgi:uncharacterized lipoprotein